MASCPVVLCDYLANDPKYHCDLTNEDRITGFTCSGSYGVNKIIPEKLRKLPGLAYIAFALLTAVYLYQALCLTLLVWAGRAALRAAKGVRNVTEGELAARVERRKKWFVHALHVTDLVMKLTMAFLALAADKYSEVSVSLIITLLIAGLFINNSVLAEQLEGSRGEAVFTSIEALVFILCLSLLDCDKSPIRIATAAFVILVVMWAVVWALGFVRKNGQSAGFNFWLPYAVDLRPWLSEAAALSMLVLAIVHLYAKVTGPHGHREYRVESKHSPPIIMTMILTLVVVAVVWIVKLTKYWGAVTHSGMEEEQQKGIPMHKLDATLPAQF